MGGWLRRQKPDDTWNGGYLEAAIVLGERDDPGSDDRVVAGLRAAWRHPWLDGWFATKDAVTGSSAPSGWEALAHIDPKEPGLQYGWIDLGGGRRSAAGTLVIREDFGSPNLDWLDVVVPLGGLGAVDRRVGAYPFGDFEHCEEWLEPLLYRLGEIAVDVCEATSARVALIGFELSGHPSADGFDGTVPNERVSGWVAPSGGDGYQYWAPTVWT